MLRIGNEPRNSTTYEIPKNEQGEVSRRTLLARGYAEAKYPESSGDHGDHIVYQRAVHGQEYGSQPGVRFVLKPSGQSRTVTVAHHEGNHADSEYSGGQLYSHPYGTNNVVATGNGAKVIDQMGEPADVSTRFYNLPASESLENVIRQDGM